MGNVGWVQFPCRLKTCTNRGWCQRQSCFSHTELCQCQTWEKIESKKNLGKKALIVQTALSHSELSAAALDSY